MRKGLLLAAALALLSAAAALGAQSYEAILCSNCAFGDKQNYCVKCGAYTFGRGAAAQLCSTCSFSNRKKHCIKCGAWLFD